MLNQIDGYWMAVIAPGALTPVVQEFTLPRLAPGTDVYATISLSGVNTAFSANSREPKFASVAFIDSWSAYKPDGSESEFQSGALGFEQNAIRIENCARIRFVLAGEGVRASAQINVFNLSS